MIKKISVFLVSCVFMCVGARAVEVCGSEQDLVDDWTYGTDNNCTSCPMFFDSGVMGTASSHVDEWSVDFNYGGGVSMTVKGTSAVSRNRCICNLNSVEAGGTVILQLSKSFYVNMGMRALSNCSDLCGSDFAIKKSVRESTGYWFDGYSKVLRKRGNVSHCQITKTEYLDGGRVTYLVSAQSDGTWGAPVASGTSNDEGSYFVTGGFAPCPKGTCCKNSKKYSCSNGTFTIKEGTVCKTVDDTAGTGVCLKFSGGLTGWVWPSEVIDIVDEIDESVLSN